MTSKKLKGTIVPMLLTAFFIGGLLSSCTHQRMTCPAYQSAFLFDTTALKAKFSYFVNDTPKIYEVNKNKFLLIEPVPYRKMMASFRTIEMLPIYPVIPDSLLLVGAEEMIEDYEAGDSLRTARGGQEDSVKLHPGLIGPKFNVEQENYMYYFRKYLILPDVRAGIAVPEKKKFSLKGWVKNLFKKKDKDKSKRGKKAEVEDSDNASLDATGEDSDGAAGGKKRKLFGRKKKTEEPSPATEPERKEEEDGSEGFGEL